MEKYPTHTECVEFYYSATVPRVTILSCSYPQDPLTRTSNPFPVNKDIFMAVPGMAQKLNTQMNLEFHASNVYLNLSEWYARHRFDGAATFLRTRAQSSITLTMRVFDYLKKAGSWPIVNPDHACNPECTSLEDLFTQTLSDYQQRSRLLSGLAQEAKAQSDDSTWRFLTLLAEEQQQDGLLLQSVLEEIRNADKAGLGMEQTDRRLMAIVGEAQKAH